jgi:hypothetical protein
MEASSAPDHVAALSDLADDALLAVLDRQEPASVAALAMASHGFCRRLAALCTQQKQRVELSALRKLQISDAASICTLATAREVSWQGHKLSSDEVRVLFMSSLRPRDGLQPMEWHALRLDHNSLEPGAANLVRALAACAPRLTTLHLCSTGLGDRAVLALADLLEQGALPHLEELNLEGNPLSDDARSAIRCACGVRVVELILDPFEWTGNATRNSMSSLWVGLKEALFNFRAA